MKIVKILLVGIGGYAMHYVNALLDTSCKGIEITGIVEAYPTSCGRLDELMERDIPLYATMDEFYERHTADLAVIGTPIQFHAEHIITALEHGSNVLCEKPLCADEKDIEKIVQASQNSGKFVDIGYQWSHNEGLLKLKADILNGVYGKLLSIKSLTLWPRNDAYFRRGSGWAGKLYDKEGRAVFDSIANNGAAHHLHNIFFLCGSKMREAVSPANFEATLMRTNKIESFDTCVISGNLENNVSFLYIASHAIEEKCGPVCEMTFEKGVVHLGDAAHYMDESHFVGTLADGTMVDYGEPGENHIRKLWLCIEAVRNNDSDKICCPIEAAAVHTKVINKLQHEFIIYDTCQDLTITKQKGSGVLSYVKGLKDALIFLYSGQPANLDLFWKEES